MRTCTDTCFQPFHQLSLLNISLLYRCRNWRNYGIWNWYGEKGGLSPLRIVLAGAAVSAFLLAISEGIGIYFKISQDISLWTAGGVIGTTWNQLKIIIPVISISIFIAILLAKN